jgi:hypothetical protein
MTNKIFLAYWDTLGFESIHDCSAYEKHLTWSALKGEKPTMKLPVQLMILRAQANPQRFPEIWTFTSEIDLKELIKYSNESPQVLADAIRKNGSKVFVTPREKEVIV